MKIISNIIRGGQLSLHAIRMFKQVLNLLLILSGSTWVILFIVSLYQNTTVEEWAGYRDYQIANILKTMHLPNKQVTVYYGKTGSTLRASTVVSSWYFQDFKEKIERKVLEGGIFGLKAGGIVFVIISIFFIYRGFRKTGEQFRRGAKLSGYNEIKKKITKDNKKKGYKAYRIGGMPYSYQGEMQHTLVIGANGTGKTVLISDVVEQIRERGDKAIIYDKKGDYTKWFYNPKKDKILNPFDRRGEEWNLLSEIEQIGNIKQIARAFVPEKNIYAEGNKIWDEAARIAFTGIVEKLFSKDEDLSNREIVDMILRQDIKKVAKLVKHTYAQSTIDPNSPKTAASVLFVLASHFNSLRLTDGRREESFSIRDWILSEEKDEMLFITSQESLSNELSPLQTAWFEIAIGSILSKEGESKQKTWVVMDELPTLQKIPSLQNGLSVTRSYEGCFVLGMQNIAQMRDIYGIDLTQNISSECNTRCIFKSNDPDTAKWLGDNIGEAEIREYKEGLSYGANTIRDGVNVNSQDRVKALILPSEIQSMERLNLLIKMPDYPAVKAEIKYKERASHEKGFIKNEGLVDKLKEIYANIEDEEDEGDSTTGSMVGEREVVASEGIKRNEKEKKEKRERIKELKNNVIL